MDNQNLKMTNRQGAICNLHINHLFKRIQSYLDYSDEVFQNYLDNSKQDIERLNQYIEEHPDNFAIITANTDDELFYIDLGNETNTGSFSSFFQVEFAYYIPTSQDSRFTILFCKD